MAEDDIPARYRTKRYTEEADAIAKRTRSQSERFEQTARDLGVEVDEGRLKDALRRMAKAKQMAKEEDRGPPDKR